MSIEMTKHPYEILIRLGPGGIEKAHFKELETITRDGEVIAAKELPPQPINAPGAVAILGPIAETMAILLETQVKLMEAQVAVREAEAPEEGE
jgi:hypothetical protein